MRNALAPPRKGETFELRAGLVCVLASPLSFSQVLISEREQVSVCLRKVVLPSFPANNLSNSVRRKESIQKTIMAMTLGKDVSALFPDVLKNIATPDLDQKKLVYLYLM